VSLKVDLAPKLIEKHLYFRHSLGQVDLGSLDSLKDHIKRLIKIECDNSTFLGKGVVAIKPGFKSNLELIRMLVDYGRIPESEEKRLSRKEMDAIRFFSLLMKTKYCYRRMGHFLDISPETVANRRSTLARRGYVIPPLYWFKDKDGMSKLGLRKLAEFDQFLIDNRCQPFDLLTWYVV